MKKTLLVCISVLSILAGSPAAAQLIITRFAGTDTGGYSGDGGPAIYAHLDAPWDIVTDTADNVYFTDFGSAVVRRVGSDGIITTIAGSGAAGYSGDGGPATAATFQFIRGLARNSNGDLFVADQNNHAIRKIDTAGIISTIAGDGTAAFAGDGGPATAAQLYYPQWLAFDPTGNMYLSDFYHVIRKIDTAGIISTFAGTPGMPGYSGDGGPATAALLNYAAGLCFDTAGNMFFVDNWNNVIRKIDAAGNIHTVAGNGSAGFYGDGGPATAAALNRPLAVIVDSAGNLFISDQSNSVIRKVSAGGIISSYAGTGGFSGFTGDLGLADTARLNYPAGLALDRLGRLYIADGNHVIRRVEPGTPIGPSLTAQMLTANHISIFPIPACNALSIVLPDVSATPVECQVISADGRIVSATNTLSHTRQISLDISSLSPGTYTLSVFCSGYTYREKLIIR